MIDEIKLTPSPEDDKKKKVKDYNIGINKRVPEGMPRLPFRWSLVGASNSGKTTFLCSLFDNSGYLKRLFHPKNIFVFSPTANLDDKLKECIPADPMNFFEEFDESVIADILSQQKALKEHKGKGIVSPVLVILDDCVGSDAMKDRNIITKTIIRLRHYNVSLICTSQKYSGVPRQVRLNCDFMCIFRVLSGEIDAILAEMSDRKSRNGLRQILIEIFDEPYQFLMVDFLTSDKTKRYRIGLDQYIDDPTYTP